jgi:hypothetical protein
MVLAIPQYVAAAGIADPELRYEWDDWKIQEMFDTEDDSFRQKMSRVSYRAALAFTIAAGEWIVHRFDRLSTDAEPLLHMEAMWAGVVDSRYVTYWEPPDAQWLGPIRGPLRLAIVFTLEALVDADQCADVALNADRASIIAERVLSNPAPFRFWRERVVRRLEQLYSYDKGDPMGDVVPREALDPDLDFQPEMTEALIRGYLRGVNPALNRFLANPTKMRERGFPGTPYEFDIAQDRLVRNDF